MDGLHSSVVYGVLFSPLATLADSVTISGRDFERDIPWSLIPGGKLAKQSWGEHVVIITWSKRGRYILVHHYHVYFEAVMLK